MHAHLRLFAIVVIPACAAPAPTIPTVVVPLPAPTCTAGPEDPCIEDCAGGDLEVCRDLRIALRRACGPNDGYACHRLARMLETGEGIEHEFGLANALHQRACQWGSSASCARLAFLHSMGDGVNIDFVQATRMVNAACSARNAVGCESLDVLHTDPTLAAADWNRGRAIYQRACNLGHGDACHALAVIYELGVGIAADRERADSLYIRACDTGDEHTCILHGFLFGNRRAPQSSGREETRQYERLCADGDNTACHRLGLVYLRDDGDSESMAVMLASHFLGRACRGGIETACLSRKELLVRRLGVREIESSWKVVAANRCNPTEALCRHGLEIVEHVGVRPPIALARPQEVEELFYRAELYKQACEQGHEGGCYRLGMMFSSGAALPQRRERAIDFLRIACQEHDNLAGCDALRREIEEPPRPVRPNGIDSQLASAPTARFTVDGH